MISTPAVILISKCHWLEMRIGAMFGLDLKYREKRDNENSGVLCWWPRLGRFGAHLDGS